MNRYLKNLSKIEFVITHACTGKCKHCSEGDHTACGESINADICISTFIISKYIKIQSADEEYQETSPADFIYRKSPSVGL